MGEEGIPLADEQAVRRFQEEMLALPVGGPEVGLLPGVNRVFGLGDE